MNVARRARASNIHACYFLALRSVCGFGQILRALRDLNCVVRDNARFPLLTLVWLVSVAVTDNLTSNSNSRAISRSRRVAGALRLSCHDIGQSRPSISTELDDFGQLAVFAAEMRRFRPFRGQKRMRNAAIDASEAAKSAGRPISSADVGQYRYGFGQKPKAKGQSTGRDNRRGRAGTSGAPRRMEAEKRAPARTGG